MLGKSMFLLFFLVAPNVLAHDSLRAVDLDGLPVSPSTSVQAHDRAAQPNAAQIFRQKALDLHNNARRDVQPPAADMRALTWSGELEKSALNYAQRCAGSHSGAPDVGENLASGSGMTIEMAIGMWVGERRSWSYYDFLGS